MKLKLLILLTTILSLCTVREARSTTIVAMNVEQMASDAELVVEGVVDHKSCRWDESGRMIITETTVRVTSSLKGRPGQLIVVRSLGGELSDIGMMAPGSPAFAEGSSVLLMLERHPVSDFRVMGLSQGKFDLKTDTRSGAVMAVGANSSLTMPLTDLRAKIDASVGRRP